MKSRATSSSTSHMSAIAATDSRRTTDQPQRDRHRSVEVVRAGHQQCCRSHAAEFTHRFAGRGVARIQQAALCGLFGGEHGCTEPAAVPAVRQYRRARRAAWREQVRLASGEGQQAVLARPQSDGDVHLAERADEHGDRRGTTANNVFDHPEDVFFVPELSEPLITVLAFNYEVPAFTQNQIVRAVLGGWTVGGIVRYASGLPIPVPASQNQLAPCCSRTRA